MNGDHPISLAEKRERLALACQLDRLNLRLAMRPTPLERLSLTLLKKVAPLVPHLPGKAGKWASSIMRGTNLFKGVYESIFT